MILVSNKLTVVITGISTMVLVCTEYPNSPQVQRTVETSNKNNATVTLEWMQEAGVSYNVTVNPNPLEIKLNGTTSWVTILYNTSYDTTVVATLCGNNMNRTVIDITVDRLGELDNVIIISALYV